MGLNTLIYKIARRAKGTSRRLLKNLAYNKRYKPLGVKNLLANDSNAIEYHELRPPFASTFDLDAKFLENCSAYMTPPVSVQFPATYIATIKNGRIYSFNESNMAVISGDNYVIEEASFQWNNDKLSPAKDNAVFSQKGFINPRKYAGKVFSMLAGGGAIYYFYHWMFDVIPKLFLLKESGQFDNVDYFLVPNYEFKYQREYLEYFGIDKNKIIDGAIEHHIQADYLMISSFVITRDHHPKWACDFLHNTFTLPAPEERNKLIYISRKDAPRNRKISNEAALMAVLTSYGFEVHFLSGMPVVEQARLFNSAKIVVGAHGAGLSNLVYCEPGTKVLEFFANCYVKHTYADICSKNELEYHYILCTADSPADNSWEGQRVGLSADVEAIKAKVSLLLADS